MQAFDPPFEMDAGIGSDSDEPSPFDRKVADKMMHSHEGANCCGRYAHLTCEPSVKLTQPVLSPYDVAVVSLIATLTICQPKILCISMYHQGIDEILPLLKSFVF